MNRYDIASLLEKNHTAFIQQLNELDDNALYHSPVEKWSAIQHADHIYRSVAPVNLALWIPKFFIRKKFGVANRPSGTWDELIARYKTKLAEGGKAIGPFVPPATPEVSKEVLLRRLSRVVYKLNRKVKRHSEESLDRYILPHPLLGKLTLREMLYFTVYHVQHHSDVVKKGLETK